MVLYKGEKKTNSIGKKIENIRYKLNKLVAEKNQNIMDSEVVKLSQKLDELLIYYIRINGDNKNIA
ncbi:aspartyl-phosphate phosphatase Spo0E family protein [Clostridium aestuarii]|uniref:Aspartyl-phosphate phosphatase Spo0E family protein n=1 Tax=Clostridium aestuarii TaxID=338193 RepID=A0ABT4D1R1_9CLOT|nr:aspartyl-phosphate phosphatase Spo0E family protein [Clostridium aestuarii]MCY6485192.1 aspartyl-phosphate phosphatase Spo0E family protein [Clostridium aestuarii]